MSEKVININIQHGIKSIPANSFMNKGIYGVSLPNTLEEIGVSAFSNNELTSVVFPDGLVKIGAYSFANNVLDKVLVLPKQIKEVGVGAFTFNRIEKVIIPKGIVKIADSAFTHNKIKNLVIPTGILEVGKYAFKDNELETVIIEDGLKELKEGVFKGNNNLKQIVIPGSVEKIGNNAFCNTDVIYDGVKITKEELQGRDCASVILIAKDKKRLNEIYEKKFNFYSYPSKKDEEKLAEITESKKQKVVFKDDEENTKDNNINYNDELSKISKRREILKEENHNLVLQVQKNEAEIKTLDKKEQEIYYNMMFNKISDEKGAKK